MSVVVDMVDPEGMLLNDIADPRMKRNDIAITYAFAIRQRDRDNIDFAKVNQAIMDRWSLSALRYIKKRAWEYVLGKRP